MVFPKPYQSGPSWGPTADAFEAFVATHGRLPSEYGDEEGEAHLARWRHRQLSHFDLLAAAQQSRLRAIPGFTADHSPAAQRADLMQRSRDFRATHDGETPSRDSDDLAERRTANWERDQRTAARRGDLTEQQATELRDAGILTDKQLADLREKDRLKPDPPAAADETDAP